MKEFKYVVTDPEGIHARPAGILVKQAAGYKSAVTIVKGEKSPFHGIWLRFKSTSRRNFRNRYYRSWSDVPFSNPDRSSCGNGRNRFVEKTTES